MSLANSESFPPHTLIPVLYLLASPFPRLPLPPQMSQPTSDKDEKIRREYVAMREQISSLAQKIAELDQDRNEHEYVPSLPLSTLALSTAPPYYLFKLKLVYSH